jgi:hypothetical protein
MGLYVIVSAGKSAGATTTALALALSWPRGALLAECDPAGGSVLAGFLADRLTGAPGPGLLGAAMRLAREPRQAPADVEDHALAVTGWSGAHEQVKVLPGIADPRQAASLMSLWPSLAGAFASVGTDVIADAGRLGHPYAPEGLLRSADVIIAVLHRSLVHLHAAGPRLNALLDQRRARAGLGLCLIDEGGYSAAAVSKQLFGLPVWAQLPYASADARVLSDGERPHLAFRTSPLIRAVAVLGQRVRASVEERAFHPGSRSFRAPVWSGDNR